MFWRTFLCKKCWRKGGNRKMPFRLDLEVVVAGTQFSQWPYLQLAADNNFMSLLKPRWIWITLPGCNPATYLYESLFKHFPQEMEFVYQPCEFLLHTVAFLNAWDLGSDCFCVYFLLKRRCTLSQSRPETLHWVLHFAIMQFTPKLSLSRSIQKEEKASWHSFNLSPGRPSRGIHCTNIQMFSLSGFCKSTAVYNFAASGKYRRPMVGDDKSCGCQG